MVVLRATHRILRMLPATTGGVATSDTSLGDWCVNRLVVDRHPLLLLVSSHSLLSIVTPARDVRALPTRLPGLVADRLRRLGIAERIVAAEVAAMAPVAIAGTDDRSVVGIMVEFAKMIPFHLPIGGWDEKTLPLLEAWLARVPCHAAGRHEDVVWPDRAAPELLAARWHAAGPALKVASAHR